MAIVAMKHLRLVGLESEREALLRALQDMGCVEVSGVDGAEDALQEGFARPDDRALLPDAMRYLEELHAFYIAGWMKIMGQ